MIKRAVLVGGLFVLGGELQAQEPIVHYDNTLRLEYQFIHTGAYQSNLGAFDFGTTDTHILLLAGSHSFNERWTVFGSLPYVQKRHQGPAAHDPNVDFFNYKPTDLRFWDDGSYHGDLQDFFAGVQYLALDGPLSVSPHISYGVPVTHYPFYADAAIGKNIWQFPVGVTLDFVPYFSDWNFRADLSYVFSEKTLGVNGNYWLYFLSARYYVTPRFAPKIFVTGRKAPHGLSFPEDFTDDYTFNTYEDFDTEWYYYHDRTIKHEATDLGIGFDYVVSDRHEIAGTFYRTIVSDNVAEVEYAFTLALNWNF